ncbi:MAG: outer membrane beta-barrel protein, partial [Bacteroidetes bacterium]|nr:outer membrane beta-barrel protein [Bacteroidota bacterium]
MRILNRHIYLVTLAIFLLLEPFSAFSQSGQCVLKLQSADRKYQSGYFDQAIDILKEAVDSCELGKDDKIVAYRIMILAYLDIDQLELADETASRIIKLDPKYTPDKLHDRADYINLFSKYSPTPVLRAGIKGGYNSNSVHADQVYSILTNVNSSALENYSSAAGFQVGLCSEVMLRKMLWLNFSPVFRSSIYSNSLRNIENTNIEYKETLNMFDLPLNARVYFLNGKLKPYAELGFQFSFLGSALGELSRDGLSDIVNRQTQRKSLTYGYLGGCGLAFHSKGSSVQVGLSYLVQPSILNVPENRYDNLSSIFKY